MDERTKKVEQEQYDILTVVQKSVKTLEEQFRDLKEQQHKILFGNRDNDDEDNENQEGETSNALESTNPIDMAFKNDMMSPKGAINNQESFQLA